PTTGQSSASAESHLCGTAFRQAIGVEVDLLCDQIPQTILHIKAGSVRFYCVTRHMASLGGLGRVLVVKPICRQDKELALIPISVFPQIAAFCSTQTTTPTKLKLVGVDFLMVGAIGLEDISLGLAGDAKG